MTIIEEPCAAYNAQELAGLLRLELQAIGVRELVASADPAALRASEAGLAVIRLQCDDGATALSVEVADLATGNQLKRELSFAEIPEEARPRALALAIATLVETSWIEVATRSPRSPGASSLPSEVRDALRKRLAEGFVDEARPTVVRVPESPKPAADSGGSFLALFAVSRTFPSRATGLLGLQLAFAPRMGNLRLWLSGDAMLGNVSLADNKGAIADIRLYWLTAGVAATWASSALPELTLGPYARVGYAFATADADSGRMGYRPEDGGSLVALLGAQATLRAALDERTFALVGCDIGYALSGVFFIANGVPTAGIADLTLGLRLGLAR